MARRKTKFKPSKVAEALRETGGIQAAAARRLGCHRETIAVYIERHDEVRRALEEAREATLDCAEHTLMDFVRGNVDGQSPRERLRATEFVLRTLGRQRGYAEQPATPPAQPTNDGLDLLRLFEKSFRQSIEGEAAQPRIVNGRRTAPAPPVPGHASNGSHAT